ncbi:hypothetical protein EUX98_g8768 [Antrodiella citrinella]|uniref:Phytocyanin domain-containing protein n=1 Tax=Antrodiella citrinella TaxID=2447956 RepID=A0A4S4M321_9APHY|nr:hypothetical protein EUX98_g8768 [Antrodiella citrinella]
MFSIKAFSLLAGVLALSMAPVGRGVQHDVTVGGPGGIIQYNPQFVNASIGDTVLFTFQQKNHTVTQSTFASPCSPMAGGFDSGFVPVADTDTGPFTAANFTVKDLNPVWVYCRQTGHCEQGMVFAINPGDKFAAFQAAAMGQNASAPPASSIPPPAAATPVTVTATVTVSGTQAGTTTYVSYPGSAAPTSVVSTDHKITVGGPNLLIFSPANITAQIGDTITFTFMQKNHTATQSSFASPCSSLTETSTSGQVGFDSGFMPVAANATNLPTFTIQVNDTAPIWTYCRQTNPVSHCASGMVFSANAVESSANSFEAFQAKAKSLASPSSGTPSPSNTTSSAQSVIVNRGAGIVVAMVVMGMVLV